MRSGSCQISSYNGRVMGMTICLAPRGGCGGVGFRRRSTRRVSGRASISASSSVVRKRMKRMPPAGYPAPQYLQSDRVRNVEEFLRPGDTSHHRFDALTFAILEQAAEVDAGPGVLGFVPEVVAEEFSIIPEAREGFGGQCGGVGLVHTDHTNKAPGWFVES